MRSALCGLFNSMEIYKRLLKYLKPYKMRLVWAAVFMALTSAMIALQTYLTKPVLDKIFIGKDMKLLYLLPTGAPSRDHYQRRCLVRSRLPAGIRGAKGRE